ncbi:uncharacterized protein [Argopecten irradians]|uniref:uncharacterized protein n=1 Tax=Argopecten irradians TaxID=31199 RepID=UPI00371291E6
MVDRNFDTHESIVNIEDHVNPTSTSNFTFSRVENKDVSKVITKLKKKKATGDDGISCRILKSSAYRSGFGCQTTLLRMLEDWRQALDCRNQVGAILMDLSKAFDCLPHDLFLRKLQTYGASGDAVRLMGSYLGNRKQRVGLGGHHQRVGVPH